MKKYVSAAMGLLFTAVAVLSGCNGTPIDSNGVVVHDSAQASMFGFDLLNEDSKSVKAENVIWDTIDGRGDIYIKVYATADLTKLIPSGKRSAYTMVLPEMGVVTDFSDLANPRVYSVISGNRKVKRNYTIHVSVKE